MNANATTDTQDLQWAQICDLSALTPDTGVCALVDGRQIAIFYSGKLDQVFAVDNFDPIGRANVLSRGIIGSLGERICVASPLYKQHFDLKTGECLEEPEHSIRAYTAKIDEGRVFIAV